MVQVMGQEAFQTVVGAAMQEQLDLMVDLNTNCLSNRYFSLPGGHVSVPGSEVFIGDGAQGRSEIHLLC